MKWYCRHCDVMKKTKGLNAPDREETRCPYCNVYMQPANFKRSAGVDRTPITRTPSSKKPRMRPEAAAAMVAWARAGVCAVCGKTKCQLVQGHHVLEQGWLISRARTLRIDAVPLLEDRRGWLRVGEPCHMGHHYTPGKRIPRLVLVEHCPDVFAFAAEYGLSLRIEQTYPDIPRARAA